MRTNFFLRSVQFNFVHKMPPASKYLKLVSRLSYGGGSVERIQVSLNRILFSTVSVYNIFIGLLRISEASISSEDSDSDLDSASEESVTSESVILLFSSLDLKEELKLWLRELVKCSSFSSSSPSRKQSYVIGLIVWALLYGRIVLLIGIFKFCMVSILNW